MTTDGAGPGSHLATSFDADVANYERARPAYPQELFGLLVARCGIGESTRVLEIGPGTGLATLPLLDLGADVLAVEPGPNMVARLRERVAGRRCRIVHSTFEDAELDGPFDVAVAGTSFHWVDTATGLRKLGDVLPGGAWLALWWNVHRHPLDIDDEWDEALRAVAERFRTDHRRAAQNDAFDVAARKADITSGGMFELVEHRLFSWPHVHDASSMRALFASFSDWSTLTEPDRSHALDAVAAIVDERFGGAITRTYSTSLYLARRV